MVAPAPEIRERLWTGVSGAFTDAATLLLQARRTNKGTTKLQALQELLKIAYLTGVDRGYDMGHSVFSPDA